MGYTDLALERSEKLKEAIMVLKEKFQANSVYSTALGYPIGSSLAAEDLAADIWGEEFIRRFWEENPKTAWAEIFLNPDDLSVMLIVGNNDLDANGNFHVAVFKPPIEVETYGQDRLYVYYDKELPLEDAPEGYIFEIIEAAGHDRSDWTILEWEHADMTDRGMHRVILEPSA